MADKSKKVKENADGPYFVDDSCSACNLCVDTAPENFKMAPGGSYAHVFKQPENQEEEDACLEAMDTCPEEAIGKED